MFFNIERGIVIDKLHDAINYCAVNNKSFESRLEHNWFTKNQLLIIYIMTDQLEKMHAILT